jgi:hypothetical protein
MVRLSRGILPGVRRYIAYCHYCHDVVAYRPMRRFELLRTPGEGSKRVREAFARSALSRVLHWAFERPADVAEVGALIRVVEPALHPALESLAAARRDLLPAWATIRTLAAAVAAGQATARLPIPVHVALVGPPHDRAGQPRMALEIRLADALIWTTLTLFAEVPRAVVRRCGLASCERVFVGTHNQRYCAPHQAEARRQAAQRALRAFRARQRARKPHTRRRR